MSDNNKLDGFSKDIELTNKEKLKSVFPECFSEGTLDIDKLLSLCGEYIDNDFEKYKFEWSGKSECLRIAQQQSRGTLRPYVEESVNFYETENLYVEGDNLEVLKLLQTSYFNRVKMIYIDPPYNTGKDFIYKDKFGDSIANYKEITSQTTKSNPEYMGKYHTNWLNMMYPRLRLASNLLTEDGVIFISIDDNEVHNLRKLCDEVFGEENFVAQIIWERAYAPINLKKHFSENHDFILCYAKNYDNLACNGLSRDKEANNRYSNPDNDPRGVWTSGDFSVGPALEKNIYKIISPSGRENLPPNGRSWQVSKEKFEEMLSDNRVWFGEDGNNTPRQKRFLADVKNSITPMTIWKYTDVGHTQDATKQLKSLFDDTHVFDYSKTVNLIKRCLELYTNSDDIILDFFSGSSTTAHAVMQLNKEDGGNRKFIMVQLPELTDEKSEAYKAGYKNICEIGKERIRRAGKQLIEDMEDPTTLDIGFKTLKLDTSNITEWDNSPIDQTLDIQVQLEELYSRMEKTLEGIKNDRSKLDVVFEIMMKMGVPFHIPLTHTEINGKLIFVVGDYLLLICLEDEITFEDVKAMCNEAPAVIVCGEKGFADSCVMSNIYYHLQKVEIEMKLI